MGGVLVVALILIAFALFSAGVLIFTGAVFLGLTLGAIELLGFFALIDAIESAQTDEDIELNLAGAILIGLIGLLLFPAFAIGAAAGSFVLFGLIIGFALTGFFGLL